MEFQGNLQETTEDLKVFEKTLEGISCDKCTHRSASTSNQSHGVETCQCSGGRFTTNLVKPKPVTGVNPRLCQNASEGCNELITFNNDEHEILCGYRKTHCKVVGCEKPMVIKDLLQHLHSEHASILYTAEKRFVEWETLNENLNQMIPLYVLDTIIWERVRFNDGMVKISFFHESPNQLTPNLLAVATLQCSNIGLADTVRVLCFGEDSTKDILSIPYEKIKLFMNLGLASGCRNEGAPLNIRQGLKIVKNISV